MKCAVCGKEGAELQRCSKCQSIYYCSRDHQVSGWKAHKSACEAVAASKSEKVTVTLGSAPFGGAGGAFINMQAVTAEALKSPGKDPRDNLAGLMHASNQRKPPVYGEPFIVKVQVPVVQTATGFSPILREDPTDMIALYNIDRSYSGHIIRKDHPKEYKMIADKVAKEGVNGAKAYMYATVEQCAVDKVEIRLGALAKVQKW